MKISINGVEYNRKGNVLQRQNDELGYSLSLHFQENHADVIKEIQNILKEEYVSRNCSSNGI